MAAVALFQGISKGHGCFPPSATASGETTKTFVNGKPVQTKGRTQYTPHVCGNTTHAGALRIVSEGASKTFFEGNAVSRIDDGIACGDTIAGEPSSNTFVE